MNLEFKHFSKQLSSIAMATAEFSLVSKSIKDDYFFTVAVLALKPLYYFNRIFVPKPFRKQGIGNELLSQAIEWANENNVNILVEVNSYNDGDCPDTTQLKSWYHRKGFNYIQNHLVYLAKEKKNDS